MTILYLIFFWIPLNAEAANLAATINCMRPGSNYDLVSGPSDYNGLVWRSSTTKPSMAEISAAEIACLKTRRRKAIWSEVEKKILEKYSAAEIMLASVGAFDAATTAKIRADLAAILSSAQSADAAVNGLNNAAAIEGYKW